MSTPKDELSYRQQMRVWIVASKRRKGETLRRYAQRISCKFHHVTNVQSTLAAQMDYEYIYAILVEDEGNETEFSPSDFPL